jgi:hypothetical protein
LALLRAGRPAPGRAPPRAIDYSCGLILFKAPEGIQSAPAHAARCAFGGRTTGRRRRPAPLLDACRDRRDLGIRVGPSVFCVRDQPLDRPPLDLVGRPRPLIFTACACVPPLAPADLIRGDHYPGHGAEPVTVIKAQTTVSGATEDARFSSIASKTGARSPGEELITPSTSAVAVCWATASSRSAVRSASWRRRSAIIPCASVNALSGGIFIGRPSAGRAAARSYVDRFAAQIATILAAFQSCG